MALVACAPTSPRVPVVAEAVDGEFWLRLQPDAPPSVLDGWDVEPVLDVASPEVASRLGLGRTYLLRGDRRLAEVVAHHPEVAWVHPHGIAHAAGLPDDELYAVQWSYPLIGIEEAWSWTRGEGMIVAVVDSGIEPGLDGLGHFLEGEGFDFVDFDADVEDPMGHGTHIAGIINQSTHNEIGVAGLAPLASILDVRVLDEWDVATELAMSQGVTYAADYGARIINLSLVGESPLPLLEDAITYANELGAVVVAAAGNQGYADRIQYPARYSSTIAVGATDRTDARAWYSNRSADLDLVAPGGDVATDLDGDLWVDGIVQETLGGFQAWAGTSMATPHVAAAAALVMEQGLADPEDVRNALVMSSLDLGEPGFDTDFGHGRLAVPAALRFAVDELAPLAIDCPEARVVTPGTVRVGWLSTRPAEGWLELPDGEVLFAGARRRHLVELVGAPGTTVWVDLVISDGMTVDEESLLVSF